MEVKVDEKASHKTVIQIVAYMVFGAMGFIAMLSVQSMTASLKEMNHSLNELNKKMAVVVTTQNTHKSLVNDHELRIRVLEQK
jgi:hypothetical protein